MPCHAIFLLVYILHNVTPTLFLTSFHDLYMQPNFCSFYHVLFTPKQSKYINITTEASRERERERGIETIKYIFMMVFKREGGGFEREMVLIWLVAFLVFLALGSVSAVPAVMGGGSHISGHRNHIERRLENLKASLAAAPASSPASGPKVSLSLCFFF